MSKDVLGSYEILPQIPQPEGNNNKNDKKEDDNGINTSCGIGSWRPKCLQMFASPAFFMINFAIVGIVQGGTGTYLVGIMTTLEKRFAFDSRTSGFIFIADNISQMVLSPIVGYLGSRYNRPLMIAIGELFLAGSCFLNAVPYFIYGPGVHLLHDETVTKLARNETLYEFCPANLTDIKCTGVSAHTTVWTAVIILWFGSFMRGLGFTAYFTVGIPFIDDSVQKKTSPLYISGITALRLIGPAFGYLLSSFSLRFYENPFYDPGINNRDPRWIGAWWLGYLIISILLTITTIPMFFFPKEFKNSTVKTKDLQDNIKGTKATKEAIKRIARNPIVMFTLVGSTIRYIGLGGLYIFKNKYIESQYRQSSSSASLFTGTVSILPMAVGIMLGGAIISIFKPRPRYVVLYNFLVEVIQDCTVLIAMFLGCPPIQLSNMYTSNGGFSMFSGCNNGCNCTTSIYTPVCSGDGITNYFNPCFAGCKDVDRSGSVDTFSGCSCLTAFNGVANAGYCANEYSCNRIATYLTVIGVGSLIASTARTGGYLVIFRSVEPKDKSFAMGLMGTFLALFAFIPYPLIFGAITDSACLIWEQSCGKRGNCWVYDQDKFRYYLHGAAFCFAIVGTICDLGVCIMSGRIKNFFDDDDEKNKKTTQTPEGFELLKKGETEKIET